MSGGKIRQNAGFFGISPRACLQFDKNCFTCHRIYAILYKASDRTLCFVAAIFAARFEIILILCENRYIF